MATQGRPRSIQDGLQTPQVPPKSRPRPSKTSKRPPQEAPKQPNIGPTHPQNDPKSIISSQHLISLSHLVISSHLISSHLIISSHHLISSYHIIVSAHHLISSVHLMISSHHLISVSGGELLYWEPLGAILGRLGAKLDGLGATFGSLRFLLIFWNDFGSKKGCPKGGILGAKRCTNRSKKEVQF